MKLKICVVVNSRANYGRVKAFLLEAKKSQKVDLRILVSASAVLYKFGDVYKNIEKDGFKIDKKIHSIVDGDTLATMAKSTGLLTIEFATYLDQLKPDIVFVIADRFENLAVATAASYMNIPLAHIQGGEVSGSIDEKVRHAITKLSDIHFVSTERARKFLIKMGENPGYVFNSGCPSIDIVKLNSLKEYKREAHLILNRKSVDNFYFQNKKYVIVLQHPVTIEYKNVKEQIKQTIDAIKKLKEKKINVVWLWPNIDAGSDEISKQIRIESLSNSMPHVRFYKNFTPEEYIKVLKNSLCVVGNSSSGIREASFLGVPCVNIGSRQSNREKSSNVIDVVYSKKKILKAILYQVAHGKYKKNYLYGRGNASKKIMKIIIKKKIIIEKKLNYL